MKMVDAGLTLWNTETSVVSRCLNIITKIFMIVVEWQLLVKNGIDVVNDKISQNGSQWVAVVCGVVGQIDSIRAGGEPFHGIGGDVVDDQVRGPRIVKFFRKQPELDLPDEMTIRFSISGALWTFQQAEGNTTRVVDEDRWVDVGKNGRFVRRPGPAAELTVP